MTRRSGITPAAWLLFACAATPAWTQQAVQPVAAHAPEIHLLQVRLQVPLNSRRLHEGASVFGSAIVPWQGPDCFLKTGASVYGRVVEVKSKSKGAQDTSVKVLFDRADCNGQSGTAITLLLFAVINHDDDPYGQNQFASQLFGASSAHPILGQQAPLTYAITMAHDASVAEKAGNGADAQPRSVSSGQVIGAGKVTLKVGTSADDPSVLQSAKQDFTIYMKSELVLIPAVRPSSAAAVAVAVAKREDAASIPISPPKMPPKVLETAITTLAKSPPDDTEVCAAAGCIAFAEDAAGTLPAQIGLRRLTPLTSLGYKPRRYVRMTGFDQDTTITYLSPQQLLVTFDTHRLRSRSGDLWPTLTRRTVRAVLVEAQTGKVERVVEWTVEGTGQYLWPAGPDRVLVHMGGALRAFGPNLKPEATLPAAGNLLWMVSSPSGHRVAVALLGERHTHEIHDQIAEFSNVDPEEDVEIQLFDRAGKLLLTRTDVSTVRNPVLTDAGGEYTVGRVRGQWQITEHTGEGSRQIATVSSSCPPSVAAASSETLFVVGCSPRGRWYRILGRNGRTLVKGAPSDRQVEQRISTGNQGVYAIRVVNLKYPLDAESMFQSATVHDEQLTVHRSVDGREIAVAREESIPQTRNSFALSPDGHQLAVLTQTAIAFYAVPGSEK